MSATTPLETLYHYTTLVGLLGIATSKRLWATSIRHLNDATEFTYAHGVLRQALERAQRKLPADVVATIKLLQKDLDFAHSDTYFAFTEAEQLTYVTSFSENDDQLSQWRAYGPSGGYSLGFRQGVVETLAREQGFDLVKCTYDAQAHRAAADELAVEIVAKVLGMSEGSRASISPAENRVPSAAAPEFFPIRRHMLDEIQRRAPSWKHPKFEEEAEWRLVSRSSRATNFRAGRSVLVPYTEIELDRPSTRINDMLAFLSRVVVGPSTEQRLAAASVIQLLKAHKIAWGGGVTLSSVPFRQHL